MIDDLGDSLKWIFGIFLGGFYFIRGFKTLMLKRLIENLPTSKINSLAMGVVELYGKPKRFEASVISPIFKQKCLCYRTVIYENNPLELRQSRQIKFLWGDDGLNKFYLEDGTGKVLIDPVRFKLRLQTTFEGNYSYKTLPELEKFLKEKNLFKHNRQYKFSEIYIKENEDIYVLGSTLKNSDENLEISGNGFKFASISNECETNLTKHLKEEILLQIFGGFLLIVTCMILLVL